MRAVISLRCEGSTLLLPLLSNYTFRLREFKRFAFIAVVKLVTVTLLTGRFDLDCGLTVVS